MNCGSLTLAMHRTPPYRAASTGIGTWRSLVAHYTGGVGVAGSNPVVPTSGFSEMGISGGFGATNELPRSLLCREQANALASLITIRLQIPLDLFIEKNAKIKEHCAQSTSVCTSSFPPHKVLDEIMCRSDDGINSEFFWRGNFPSYITFCPLPPLLKILRIIFLKTFE